MATNTKLKLKKSSVVGRVPVAGDLEYGELALNYADGIIYYKNASNAVKEFESPALTHSATTKTYTVTVASKDASHRYNGTGSGLGYKIDGVFSPFLKLTPGRTYKFDISDLSLIHISEPTRPY